MLDIHFAIVPNYDDFLLFSSVVADDINNIWEAHWLPPRRGRENTLPNITAMQLSVISNIVQGQYRDYLTRPIQLSIALRLRTFSAAWCSL